jgi:hypothetical protein
VAVAVAVAVVCKPQICKHVLSWNSVWNFCHQSSQLFFPCFEDEKSLSFLTAKNKEWSCAVSY